MPAKPWYLSKTILMNLLMGFAMMIAYFVPSVSEFIKQYFAEAGLGWAFVNVLLRAITKQEIG